MSSRTATSPTRTGATAGCSDTQRGLEEARIELPNGQRERRRKADPRQIGQQEPGSEWLDCPETDQGQSDEQQQAYDVDRGPRSFLPGEEEPRPERVGGQLCEEQHVRPGPGRRA